MEMPLVSNVAERELLQAAESHQMLLDPDALRELLTCEAPQDVLQQAIAVARGQNEFMVRHSLVADLIAARQLERKSVAVVENTRFAAPAKNHEPDIRIFKDREVTRKSRCTGKLEDFVEHFKDRFTQMKGLMNNRRSEYPVMDRLSRAAGKGQREKMRLVGMVYEKRTTKNGHVLIELEDETATVTALVSKNSKILGLTQSLMEDEVVAFDGFFNGELFILDDIVWPDVPIRDKKHGEADVNIGFLSDLHVGSKYFLQHQFQQFLEFLNGKGTDEEKEIAGKIKYLFIAGDLVDGIGVYPTQEKQLITKDIYEQYKSMGEFLMQIPDHIHVILAPGNHDAVRTAEPQPALFDEFAQGLEKKDNMHLVGNPAWFEVEGLKVLMYHGTSLDSLIASMNKPEGYIHPEKMGIELMKRRHLAPTYGDKPLVPEHRDYMVVAEPPDIFHFGHVHKNGYADYRGTFVVNSGTWQDTTDFQKRIGHVPSPCQFPVYNVASGNLRVLDFRGTIA